MARKGKRYTDMPETKDQRGSMRRLREFADREGLHREIEDHNRKLRRQRPPPLSRESVGSAESLKKNFLLGEKRPSSSRTRIAPPSQSRVTMDDIQRAFKK